MLSVSEYIHAKTDWHIVIISIEVHDFQLLLNLIAYTQISLYNKKVCYRREAAGCFVYVSS